MHMIFHVCYVIVILKVAFSHVHGTNSNITVTKPVCLLQGSKGVVGDKGDIGPEGETECEFHKILNRLLNMYSSNILKKLP